MSAMVNRLDPADLADLLPHTIKVRTRSGSDGYGAPTYQSTVRTYRALVAPAHRRTTYGRHSPTNEREDVPNLKAHVASTDIVATDEVEYNNTRYVVDSVETIPDEAGINHQVLEMS